MTRKAEIIFDEAVALPTQERAELIDRLIRSLNAAEQSAIDDAWLAEARKRLDAYRRGEVESVPADEVFGHGSRT